MKSPYLLGDLLKNVSRSFYLTLRVLPAGLREPVGLAYLLARAADTIADTQIVPPAQRLELLLAFRRQVIGPPEPAVLRRIAEALGEHQSNPHERMLLKSLAQALTLLELLSETDRAEVRQVVVTLSTGMELDLGTFPLETSGAVVPLQQPADLDRYTYLVAGCVGEFWTKMMIAHLPAVHHWDVWAMSACGVRFGKALQMTNVLRDCPKDLRIGRCYLPLELLRQHGLAPEDLLKPGNSLRALPVQRELLRLSLEHYRAAGDYILKIPRRCVRMRLACLWPVVIGLATLEQLAHNPDWLDPRRPSKVTRGFVYRTMAFSLPLASSNTAVRAWLGGWLRAVERAVAGV